MKNIKVYGITPDAYAELEKISATKFGKPNVSHLARDLLLAELQQTTTQPIQQIEYKNKTRLELKLPHDVAHYLQETAKVGHISPNQLAIAIIQSYIDETPVLTNNEINALYQSNSYLLRIGRNLNQIAKQLNSFESASLTSQHITNLHQFIKNHTDKIGKIIMKFRPKRQGKIP